MNVHYIQHVPFEGLGSISSWVSKNNHNLSVTKLFDKNAVFPKLSDIDLLIVLGGPMSVNDEKDFKWLTNEKQFIKECILSLKPVLGICLGAQLIASAMGAKVYKNKVKEIGWFDIKNINSNTSKAYQFPESVKVFHWHGETFDLPINAVHLAKSDNCQNQAFQLGCNTIGLQFHIETTPFSLKEIIKNCKNEIIPSNSIQSIDKMLSAENSIYSNINDLMDKVLHYLTRNINFD